MDQSKIILVEDDEFLREVYLEALTGEGYVVEVGVDGQEGYDKIKQGGYDLVLLDIILPTMSGLDIMQKIKAEGGTTNPNKKLIFLTNLDKDEEIKQALTLGDGYLIKSQLTPGDLIKEVQLYLASVKTVV